MQYAFSTSIRARHEKYRRAILVHVCAQMKMLRRFTESMFSLNLQIAHIGLLDAQLDQCLNAISYHYPFFFCQRPKNRELLATCFTVRLRQIALRQCNPSADFGFDLLALSLRSLATPLTLVIFHMPPRKTAPRQNEIERT